MLVDFFQPVVKVQEWLSVEQVEHQDDTVCTFVVSIGNGSIPFLTSRIPNLKFDFLAIVPQRPKSEVDTYGWDIILIELVVCKPD